MSGRLCALTIRQPWAEPILLGLKRLENRSWTWAEAIGRDVAIHAGAALPTWQDLLALREMLRDAGAGEVALPERQAFPRGCVVAVARFGTPLVASRSPWFVGPFAWPLAELRVLPEPVPCTGHLGFWELPPEVLVQVTDQVKVELWPARASAKADLHSLRGPRRRIVTDLSRPTEIRDERPGRCAWPRGQHPAVCPKYARGAA